jgi:Tol biopolymer transport system component
MAALLVVAGSALAGNGKGKPGGGGEEPAPDPAIAFVRGGAAGDIVVMNADGSNETLVIAGDEHRFPTWSPDGNSLVFWSDVQGFGIYVVDLDGTGLRKVATVNTGISSRPVWSPVPHSDGNYKIAFCDRPIVDGAIQDNFDVFLVNPDGSGRVNLTNSPNNFEAFPSWSPDADQMAVWRVRSTSEGTHDLIVLNIGADLSVVSRRNLTDAADVPGGLLNDINIHYPMWANNSNRIAVAANNSSSDIWIFDLADEAVPVRVTNTGSLNESAPTWSPDDSALALSVSARKGRDQGIYVLHLSSGVEERIRSGAGGFGFAAWRRNR